MSEQTHITDLDAVAEAPPVSHRAPVLVVRDSRGEAERVVRLDPKGLTPVILGRAEDCDVVLADTAISRRHLMVRSMGHEAEVTDLGSTNGSYLGGIRLEGTVHLAEGQSVQIGRHFVTLDWRDPERAEAQAELNRDLERASRYVASLLPRRITEGPVLLDWAFEPSAKLGGDVFGWHTIDEKTIAGYLIDVSGHGVGAAMHSTTVLSTVRRQALSDCDFRDPAQVLTRLNETFQMDEFDGFCFTIWYGVYELSSRVLRYSSGGHHPAYMVSPMGGAPLPLRVRNPVMGAIPGCQYNAAEMVALPGAQLHIFSDGCFEIETRDQRKFGLSDFVPLLAESPWATPERIYEAVRSVARPGPLADDFSILSVTFA